MFVFKILFLVVILTDSICVNCVVNSSLDVGNFIEKRSKEIEGENEGKSNAFQPVNDLLENVFETQIKGSVNETTGENNERGRQDTNHDSNRRIKAHDSINKEVHDNMNKAHDSVNKKVHDKMNKVHDSIKKEIAESEHLINPSKSDKTSRIKDADRISKEIAESEQLLINPSRSDKTSKIKDDDRIKKEVTGIEHLINSSRSDKTRTELTEVVFGDNPLFRRDKSTAQVSSHFPVDDIEIKVDMSNNTRQNVPKETLQITDNHAKQYISGQDLPMNNVGQQGTKHGQETLQNTNNNAKQYISGRELPINNVGQQGTKHGQHSPMPRSNSSNRNLDNFLKKLKKETPVSGAVDSRQANADSRQANADSRQPKADSRQANADSRQPNADSRQANADSRQPKADSRQANADSRQPNADSRQANVDSRQPKALRPKKKGLSSVSDHDHELATKLQCSSNYSLDLTFCSIRSWELDCTLTISEFKFGVTFQSADNRKYQFELFVDNQSEFKTIRDEDNLTPVCIPSHEYKSVCLYFADSTTIRQPSVVSIHAFLVMDDNMDNTIALGSLDLCLNCRPELKKHEKVHHSKSHLKTGVVQPERLELDSGYNQPVVQYWNPSNEYYPGHYHDNELHHGHHHHDNEVYHGHHHDNEVHHASSNHDNTHSTSHSHTKAYYSPSNHGNTHDSSYYHGNGNNGHSDLGNSHDSTYYHSNAHKSPNDYGKTHAHYQRRPYYKSSYLENRIENNAHDLYSSKDKNSENRQFVDTQNQNGNNPKLGPHGSAHSSNVNHSKRSNDQENNSPWIPIQGPVVK